MIREITRVYSRGSKLYPLYNEWLKWVIRRNNVLFNSKKKQRLNKIVAWRARKVRTYVFIDNPKAVWIQDCSMFGHEITVKFLEEV